MANKVLLTAVLLISVLFATGIQAQTQNTHMKFMGISMGDKIGIFVNKLKGKKFILIPSSEERDPVLRGKIFFSPVLANVVTSPKSNVISKVFVLINTESTYDATRSKYASFLDALTQKYGEPTSPSQKSAYEPLNKSRREVVSSDILQKDGKKYISSWLMAGGEIVLYISVEFRLCLVYYDRINLDKSNKEFKQIIDAEL